MSHSGDSPSPRPRRSTFIGTSWWEEEDMNVAWIAYRTIRRSLLQALETQPMGTPVTASLIFDGLSIYSLGKVSWEVWPHSLPSGKKQGTNWRLLAYLLIMAYLAAFATIVSVMTGYQTTTTPHYRRTDAESLVHSRTLSSEFSHSRALILDGERIGLQQNTNRVYLRDKSTEELDIFRSYEDAIEDPPLSYDCSGRSAYRTRTGNNPLPSFTIQFDTDGSNDGSACTYTTSNMTLNSTTYTLPNLPLQLLLDQVYVVDEMVLDHAWLEQNTICQPQQNYQWGFSSALFLTFCTLTFFCAAMLMVLHWDVWWYSRSNRLNQPFSLYRDILDLAREIKEDINIEDDDDDKAYLRADELEEKVKMNQRKIYINVDEFPLARYKSNSFEGRERRHTLKAIAIGKGIEWDRH